MTELVTQQNNDNLSVFTFGKPEPVMSGRYSDYAGVFPSKCGEFWRPPYNKKGLAELLRANAHHGTIPRFKRNMIMRDFTPSIALSRKDLKIAVFDYLVFGECYFYLLKNVFGEVLRLEPLKAINMRVKLDGDYRMLLPDGKHIDYDADYILHIKEDDIEQDVYGVPQYISGLQDILLNESATLFRRRYYENGAHVGFILYTSMANMSPEDEKKIEQQLQQSKGVGNFRSMFLNVPNGKEKAVQVLPVGDFSSKDDLANMKNITRNDIISVWRMPAALAGIMPENAGGFGDLDKIDTIYNKNEIQPEQLIFFEEINSVLNKHLQIGFKGLEEAA